MWVGIRRPLDPESENLKEKQMFTGFKQINDNRRSIAPDGSVRITLQLMFSCTTVAKFVCYHNL